MTANALALREGMVRAAENGRAAASPYNYYWSAVWWRLHAKESKSNDPLRYSRNQMALFRDMQGRPDHYRRRPEQLTDWQHSGLAA